MTSLTHHDILFRLCVFKYYTLRPGHVRRTMMMTEKSSGNFRPGVGCQVSLRQHQPHHNFFFFLFCFRSHPFFEVPFVIPIRSSIDGVDVRWLGSTDRLDHPRSTSLALTHTPTTFSLKILNTLSKFFPLPSFLMAHSLRPLLVRNTWTRICGRKW